MKHMPMPFKNPHHHGQTRFFDLTRADLEKAIFAEIEILKVEIKNAGLKIEQLNHRIEQLIFMNAANLNLREQ